MTKYEKISIAVAACALIVSLISAVLQPILVYHWFDPATKDYRERGQFLDSEIVINPDGRPLTCSIDGVSELELRAVLTNRGARPIKNPQLVGIAFSGKVRPLTLRFSGEVPKETTTQGRDILLVHPGSVAPGQSLSFEAKGAFRLIYVRTEYGDMFEVFSCNSNMPIAPPVAITKSATIKAKQ